MPPRPRRSAADLVRYAGASGDFNIIHWNERSQVGRAAQRHRPRHADDGEAARVVTDWLGDPGAVVEYGVRFTRPVVVPDPGGGDGRVRRPGFLQGGRAGRIRADGHLRRPDRDGAGARLIARVRYCHDAGRSDPFRYAAAPRLPVFAMLSDPNSNARSAPRPVRSSYQVDIHAVRAEETVIVCRRTLPTDGLPDFVKPFNDPRARAGRDDRLGRRLMGTAVESVPSRLAFTSQPLSMTGQLDLHATAAGRRARSWGPNLVAKVPLLGGRVEKACEPLDPQSTANRRIARVATWLARSR